MEQGTLLQGKMNKVQSEMNKAVIIGDSSHNTLSVVRSLGIAKIPFILILKHNEDTCNVKKSKYLKQNAVIDIQEMSECDDALSGIKDGGTIICTFDEAAEWIDEREPELSTRFITPCWGNQIGNLFNKDAQCELARECGLEVPESVILHRNATVANITIPYPVLIKPLFSTKGEKSDIHICRDKKDLDEALAESSSCNDFILQEFIDKEYELNCLGISTENSVIIPGGVKKIRHYPPITGACSFGKYTLAYNLNINFTGIEKFIRHVGYHGPFSVEFLHTADGRNYFMEVNFRNDGLAQTATNAGINLYACLLGPDAAVERHKLRQIYMMNYSIDYLHTQNGRLTKSQWWRDFLRTRCFINASIMDPAPLLHHYYSRILKK